MGTPTYRGCLEAAGTCQHGGVDRANATWIDQQQGVPRTPQVVLLAGSNAVRSARSSSTQ
jgi:hypothetical protein